MGKVSEYTLMKALIFFCNWALRKVDSTASSWAFRDWAGAPGVARAGGAWDSAAGGAGVVPIRLKITISSRMMMIPAPARAPLTQGGRPWGAGGGPGGEASPAGAVTSWRASPFRGASHSWQY